MPFAPHFHKKTKGWPQRSIPRVQASQLQANRLRISAEDLNVICFSNHWLPLIGLFQNQLSTSLSALEKNKKYCGTTKVGKGSAVSDAMCSGNTYFPYIFNSGLRSWRKSMSSCGSGQRNFETHWCGPTPLRPRQVRWSTQGHACAIAAHSDFKIWVPPVFKHSVPHGILPLFTHETFNTSIQQDDVTNNHTWEIRGTADPNILLTGLWSPDAFHMGP